MSLRAALLARAGTMRRCLTIWLVFLASPALALLDGKTGFGIDPPEPFAVRREATDATEVSFAITSRTGKPEADPKSKFLCRARLTKHNNWVGAPQLALDDPAQRSARKRNLRAVFDGFFQSGGEADFVFRGVPGTEFTATDIARPEVHLHFSVIDLSTGRVTLNCTTVAGDFGSAAAQFRAIRASLSLPHAGKLQKPSTSKVLR